ncbi:MAG TPA: Mut7-C RNAse domain-containing protein, partial [Spirochaetota bacterium]|nr:Mut7-C RNAse domain-containing protein [Spirochaetota bacterium]
ELAEISARENRILLTRDRGLLKRKIVTRGLIIRNTDPEQQVLEVLARLHLRDSIRPFTRCISCNGIITALDMKSELFQVRKETLPSGVLAWCSEYFICDSCGKIYWKGSHYDRMCAMVEAFRKGE